jgi:SH3-like domain-containing protein
MTLARRLLLLTVLSGPALPAAAQMSPPPGILTLPKRQPAGAAATQPPATPPQPAPVEPVQQVAPFTSTPAPAVPAKPYVPAPDAPARPAVAHKPKKPTPVVQAPPNVHAQRAAPGTAKPAAGKPGSAKATAAAPAPAAPAVAEPVVGAATGNPAETVGSVTKLPLPRWASLRADEVNLRVGPGMRFPIDWQYHRRDLPVRILREVEVWRLVQDQDGVKGWVHSATLIGRRSFVVKGSEATVRAAAADDAAPVARLKPGVVGRIRTCEAGAAWCEVQAADYKGWLRRDQFYGTDPGEAVTP